MYGFYDEYIRLSQNLLKQRIDKVTPYKIDYLKKIIKDDRVYKFISLDGDEAIAQAKLDTFRQGKIWYSYYKTLNDETEFKINYNAKYISRKTGKTTADIDLLVNFLTQMYDVYSLTYDYQDYMWDDYAAHGNGICIEYIVGDYDYLYPVEYVKKVDIDFNDMIVNAINFGDTTLSIIPWVIKNPYNITCELDSTREKEVRMLYSPYDKGELNYGVLQMDIKERLGYKGIAEPYNDFQLNISKIIIGERCNQLVLSDLLKYLENEGINYEHR